MKEITSIYNVATSYNNSRLEYQSIPESIKHYDWGKIGHDSIITRYISNKDTITNIPYAELWYETDFYLFKLLSINKPLSIQSHPDKQNAIRLHHENRLQYPDSNDKPEMAIALTTFEAFCGFLSTEEYNTIIKRYPCLLECFGESQNMKNIFYTLMTIQQEKINICIEILKTIVDSNHIFHRILNYYPSDRGVLTVFILQYYKLEKDQALFIPPNTIHYYISGDIIEIMNKSDNVIRGGLTSKFIDLPNLLSTLEYHSSRNYTIHYSILYDTTVQCQTSYTNTYTLNQSTFSILNTNVNTINNILNNHLSICETHTLHPDKLLSSYPIHNSTSSSPIYLNTVPYYTDTILEQKDTHKLNPNVEIKQMKILYYSFNKNYLPITIYKVIIPYTETNIIHTMKKNWVLQIKNKNQCFLFKQDGEFTINNNKWDTFILLHQDIINIQGYGTLWFLLYDS